MTPITAAITIDPASYLYPEIEAAVKKHLPGASIAQQYDADAPKTFHYAEYEDLDFDRLNSADSNYLACSYVYRKGLIRKHYLANTVAHYTAKHPESPLKQAFPECFNIEVDYAEFLDDALDEAFELRSELEQNAALPDSVARKTWILKPSMSDRGQGIRLFQTIDGLQRIFDEFEEDNDDEEDPQAGDYDNKIITSQLRHFVVQEYVANTLLLPAHDARKFHIRTYVLCVGDLRVYVYREMLALFALAPYAGPPAREGADGIPLRGHLTNTCLQGEHKDDKSVALFWALEGLGAAEKEAIYAELCAVTGDLFRAAAANSMHFQARRNAFEIYGLDFLVTEDLHVKLLEVNAYPDFKQTGPQLVSVITALFDAVVETAVKPYFDNSPAPDRSDLTLVYQQQDN